MKKNVIIVMIILCGLIMCFLSQIPEPESCAMCDDLSRHALCIINLSSGEKLELDVYEPHPFLVGEIAEEQPGGYFCFIRGAGIEGYKVAAEYIVITVPAKSKRINRNLFCNNCRESLAHTALSGYVLVDLKKPTEPVVYQMNASTSFSVRCYNVSINQNKVKNEYEIQITGIRSS